MNAKRVLFTAVFVAFGTLLSNANPVSPIRDVVPFPDEIKVAVNSQSLTRTTGQAQITFHISDAGEVLLDNVDASSPQLLHHIYKTVHGMQTSDTTLVVDRSYTVEITVK